MDYELHLTVNTNEVERFKAVCSTLGVKPIVIDLQDRTGNTVFHDVMTSSKFHGPTPMVESKRIADGLKSHNFEVIRCKIEVPPWDPAVPRHPGDLNKGYFESHIRILTNEGRIPELRSLATKHELHVSRNIFKRLENGMIYIMITLRSDGPTVFHFQNYVDTILDILEAHKFVYDKNEVEYVVYDSNKDHDKAWIDAGVS